MSIRLSEPAAQRVHSHLTRRGHGVGLRLGVKRTGCSGWAYAVDFADKVDDDDVVFEDQGVKVVVKREHLDFLDGMEVDFVSEGLGSAFKFHNPNVTDECGCGESFSVQGSGE